MKIRVHSILSLKEVLGGREVEMIVPEGTTVSRLLAGMIEIWGDSLSPHLFRPGSDQLLPYIRLMVNGQTIQFLDGMQTVLKDGDEVLLLPLRQGGRAWCGVQRVIVQRGGFFIDPAKSLGGFWDYAA